MGVGSRDEMLVMTTVKTVGREQMGVPKVLDALPGRRQTATACAWADGPR